MPPPLPGVSTRGVGTRAKATARPGREGLKAAASGVVVGLLLGPLVGVLWLWVAPAPTAINTEGLIFLKDQNTSEFIAADGWFLIVGFAVGVVTGVLSFLLFRRKPIAAVVGMTLGAVGGAWIAWKVGVALGPEPLEETASSVPEGGLVSAPISLRAKGVLLGWPVGGLIAFVSLFAGLEKPPETPAAVPGAVPEGTSTKDVTPAGGIAIPGAAPVRKPAPIRPITRPGQGKPLGAPPAANGPAANGPAANGPAANGRGPSVGADGRPGELGTGQGR